MRHFLIYTTSTTQNSGLWRLLPNPLLLKYGTLNILLTKTNTLKVSFHSWKYCTPRSFLSTASKITNQEMVLFLQVASSCHLKPLSLIYQVNSYEASSLLLLHSSKRLLPRSSTFSLAPELLGASLLWSTRTAQQFWQGGSSLNSKCPLSLVYRIHLISLLCCSYLLKMMRVFGLEH